MEQDYFKNLARTCTDVMNDPHKNIQNIFQYINKKDDITILALYKVFNNIIPLYKIKIKEDKIQHKKEFIKLQTFEKNLYHYYKLYIKTINKTDTIVSFKIAVELLSFDHFNFTDVIIEKVFVGCNKHEVSNICVEAICKKLESDTIGEVTFKILLCLLEFKWCSKVYKGITNVNIINRLSAEDIKPKKEEKKEREIIDANELKKFKKNKKRNDKRNIRSKADKKTDKEMAKIKKDLKIKNDKENEKETLKMLAKTVDNLMRIYFIILDEKKCDLYEFCYQGLVKYKRFIAFEFREGLYIYLSENAMQGKYDTRLKCMQTILSIYGEEIFEFKSLFLGLYELITPLKYNYSFEQRNQILDVLRKMLIDKRQSSKIIEVFLIRMMQFASTQSFEGIIIIINKILSSYKINIHDFEILQDSVYKIENDDYEKNGSLPFYGGSIIIKIL